MQTTTNYALRKPDGTDPVKISDLNLNFDVIDAKIKAIEGKTETIPSRDGTMQTNFNADMLDGYHASSFALKDGNVQTNLNADLLDGKHASSFPLKDGTVQTNLNADLLDGKHATDFAAASHSHDRLIGTNSNIIRVDNVNDTIGLNQTNNVDIKSWYGVSFSNACPGDGVQGKPTVSVNVRNGDIMSNGSIWLNGDVYINGQSLFQSASNGKNSIVNAITGKGGSANINMTFEQLANAMSSISGIKLASGTTTVYSASQQEYGIFYLPNQSFTVLGWFAHCNGGRCGSIRNYDLSEGAWFGIKNGSTYYGLQGNGYVTSCNIFSTSGYTGESRTANWYAIGY